MTARRSLRPLVLAGLVGIALAAPAHAKKPPKVHPPPCTGRFVVDGGPLLGGADAGSDAIAVSQAAIAIDSGCDPVVGKLKRTGKLTSVSAKWKACTSARGVVRLAAKVDAACTTLKGTLKGRKLKRRFKAHRQTPASFTAGDFVGAALGQDTIGPAGGTLTVGDPTSPLHGLAIMVPPGATDQPLTFTVSSAPITDAPGLPAGAVVASRLIRIDASGSDAWNTTRMLRKPALVTLPYVPPALGEESVRFYGIAADGALEAMGLERFDGAARTVSFWLRSFGDVAEATPWAGAALVPAATPATRAYAIFVGIGLAGLPEAWRTYGHAVDTGFRPSRDGWYVPNTGSYYKNTRGGSCFGFVSAARYYYRKHFGPTLFDNYRDANRTPTWVDDAVAIEFNARVQNELGEIWEEFLNGELNVQQPSSIGVALSIVGAVYVTGVPAIMAIWQAIPNPAAEGGVDLVGGHAISVYRVDIAPSGGAPAQFYTFHVYDPNHPGKDDRTIQYAPGDGFSTYYSQTSALDSRRQYNFLKHISYWVGLPDAVIQDVKDGADRGYADDSVFPKITVTRITGAKNGEVVYDASTGEKMEDVSSQGEHEFVTSDSVVRIRGTVLGGLAQDECCVVDNLHVLLSNATYFTSVQNGVGAGDGSFAFDLPIPQGENELVLVADNEAKLYGWWAGFWRDVIKSTASPAALTVTLNWGQSQSDVDLYVKEPDAGGKTGDTVFYGHRRGASATSPYLDIDNTRGFGPEHYYATSSMHTLYTDLTAAPNLYGDYTCKVHYYADHDGDSMQDQPITFDVSWRYLAFCPDPCASPEEDGYWIEGGTGGALTAAGAGNCCDIEHTGPDWSFPITISYPPPDPAQYVPVPARDVMLP